MPSRPDVACRLDGPPPRPTADPLVGTPAGRSVSRGSRRTITHFTESLRCMDERIMCLAAPDELDALLPERLRTDDLQPLPVDDLEQIHGFYRGVAPTLPLRRASDIAVVD